MKQFTTLMILLSILVFFGCQESQKRIVDYETKIVFIEDGSPRGINEQMPSEPGWEIKSSSRVKKQNDLTIGGVQFYPSVWGTEYMLQKPIYEE